MIKSTRSRWVWARIATAVLLTLFFIAAVLPNAGHVVIDKTTQPPTVRIVDRFRDGLILVGIGVAPLLLILVGAFRVALLEFIGWALLIGMLVLIFLG